MTDLNNENTKEETTKTDAMRLSFVLSECRMNGSEILIATDVRGVNVDVIAEEFIEAMLHSLPEHVLDKLETASSDAELRDALSIVINKVNSVPCIKTVKDAFDRRMSEIAHKKLMAEMLMENNYFGHEILLLVDFAQTALQWANVFAYAKEDEINEECDFKYLLDITADVKSGETVVEPDGTVKSSREYKMWNFH
jgi:hypothetical protein